MMRTGYRREARSGGSAKQRHEPMNKNRLRGASAGRVGEVPRSPRGRQCALQYRGGGSHAPLGVAGPAGRPICWPLVI